MKARRTQVRQLSIEQLDDLARKLSPILDGLNRQRVADEFGGDVAKAYGFLTDLDLTLRAAGFPTLKGGVDSLSRPTSYRIPNTPEGE